MRRGITLIVMSLTLLPASAEARGLTRERAADASVNYVFDQGLLALSDLMDAETDVTDIEADAPDAKDCWHETPRIVNCNYTIEGLHHNVLVWKRTGTTHVVRTRHGIRVTERRYVRERWPGL